MELFAGLLFVLGGGIFQGSFVLPMTLTKKWEWEHTWAAFSLLGMWILNWVITLLLIPNILSIYQAVPGKDIIVLALFGCGWGIGAILFGMGMDKLGMALGYPIIMGLIASLGALIPLVVFHSDKLSDPKGLMLLAGTVFVVGGIVLCSKAAAAKESCGEQANTPKASLKTGLIIAVMAGVLSCFPNIGMAFSDGVKSAATEMGVKETMANNTVWALFFTMGGVMNLLYCAFLMLSRKNVGLYLQSASGRNVFLCVLMAGMWIGSFYLYGAAAARMGNWGGIIGWPVFIALSIVVGNLWGLWRGEWKGASAAAKKKFAIGMCVLLAAVAIIGLSECI